MRSMLIKDLREYFIRDLKWGWNREAQTVFNFLVAAGKFVRGGVVLDAGAGYKRYKPFFQKSLYLSQEHSAGIHLKGMQGVQYSLINPIDKKIPLKDSCLDAILSTVVLEHLRYPDRFFQEAFRVLKPGGKVFVQVPFFYFEHEVPYDYNRPTRYGLKRWLEDAGFKKLSIRPTSSCTANVVFFLPYAFVYDLFRTNKHPKYIFEHLIKTHQFYRLIVMIPLFIVAFFGYVALILFGELIKLIADRGPYIDANMPMGWIAVGMKPGRSTKRLFRSEEDFLKKYREVSA